VSLAEEALMKPPLLLLIAFACLLLAGCPSYSLYPLYTDQDAVSEPALEGAWSNSEVSDKKELVFQKSSDHEYDLTTVHPDTKVTQTYKVHLVRLGTQMFMDLIADDQTINGANLEAPIGTVPTHVILKVKVSGDDFAYATLEDEAVRKQHASGGAGLNYQIVDGGVLLMTPTDALRPYISAHAEDLFSKFDHLKRKSKRSPQP
jgi:hypothetical protein